jgi:riboflavin transporter FmnP
MKPSAKIRILVGTAMLTAVSVVLSYIEFPMPFAPAFAKMDFSDLPALLAAFAYGPLAGVVVELIKNLLGLMKGGTGGIGELANFVIGASLVVPAGLIYKLSKSRKTALIGMLVGSVCMGIVAALMNYFVLLPLYTMFMPMDTILDMFNQVVPFIHTQFEACLFSALPGNLGKGLVISLITFVLYKHLSPILKGEK